MRLYTIATFLYRMFVNILLITWDKIVFFAKSAESQGFPAEKVENYMEGKRARDIEVQSSGLMSL